MRAGHTFPIFTPDTNMASIPLLGQQPQIQSPLSIQGMLSQVRLQQQSLQQQQAIAPIIQQQAQQQLQQQQVQTQLAQQDLKDRQLLTEGLQQSGGDYMKALDYATQNGASGNFALNARVQYANAVAATAKATSDQLNAHQTQLNMIGTSMGAVLDAPPEEKDAEFGRQINQLKMGGVPAAMLPGSRPTDQQLTQMRNSNAVALGILKDAQSAQEAATKHPAEVAAQQAQTIQNYGSSLGNTKSDAEWQAIYGTMPPEIQGEFPAHWSPENAQAASMKSLPPAEKLKIESQIPVDKLEMQSFLASNTGKTPYDYMVAKGITNAEAQLNALRSLGLAGGALAPGTPGGQGGPPLTPAQTRGRSVGMDPTALDQAAQNYLQTGQLRTTGRGLAATAQGTAIMNRAAELDPSGNIAANKDVQKSYASSLDAVQKNLSTVSAFENTAIANLDNMLNKARAVPELSTRFANIPVRMISSQMLGTPEMSAFKAAQQTAAAEAAKVLGSANASGVLSDTQKKEAEDILDGNLPYPAMEAAVNTLKQDFANRHASYQAQVNDLQSRMRSTPTQPGTTAQTQPAGGGLIYARDPQGKLHSAPAGTKLPAGWTQAQAPK